MLRIRIDKTVKANHRINGRHCNLSCIWCHHDYVSHSVTCRSAITNDMFADAVERTICASLADESTIRIAGDGEPTLVGCEELSELIRRLQRIPKVKATKLTTNGILLGDMAAALHDVGLKDVTVSINSLKPATYRAYSGKNRLDKVLRSINEVLRLGMAVKLNVIYSRLNADELPLFLDLANEKKA